MISQVSNCFSKVENVEFQFQESGKDDLCGSVKCKAKIIDAFFFLSFCSEDLKKLRYVIQKLYMHIVTIIIIRKVWKAV